MLWQMLFGKLRRNALVESVRGPGGGYRLARAATKISVAHIIDAVDEAVDATQCKGKENCLDERRCLTHDLWANLNTHMVEYLDGVSLEDLVAEQRARLSRCEQSPRTHVLRDRRPPVATSADLLIN